MQSMKDDNLVDGPKWEPTPSGGMKATWHCRFSIDANDFKPARHFCGGCGAEYMREWDDEVDPDHFYIVCKCERRPIPWSKA